MSGPPWRHPKPNVTGTAVHANGRIVLIEDDESLRGAIERILRGSGYDVLAFDSAESFQSSLSGEAFPSDCLCVICDVRLPGINGFELRRRFVESGDLPPWIYISAYDDMATHLQVEREGAIFLQKPFPGRTLLGVVAKHVGS